MAKEFFSSRHLCIPKELGVICHRILAHITLHMYTYIRLGYTVFFMSPPTPVRDPLPHPFDSWQMVAEKVSGGRSFVSWPRRFGRRCCCRCRHCVIYRHPLPRVEEKGPLRPHQPWEPPLPPTDYRAISLLALGNGLVASACAGWGRRRSRTGLACGGAGEV